MPKAKSVKKSNVTSNQKYIIVAAALALAAAGYFGYKSMLTKPDINKIDVGGNSRGDRVKTSKPTYRMEPINKKTINSAPTK